MTKDTAFNPLRAALLAAVLTAASGYASAQTPPPPKSSVATPASVLSLGEIESRLVAQGVKIREIEVRDLLVEVEGYDAQGREIELVIDRRSGETLSHKFDK